MLEFAHSGQRLINIAAQTVRAVDDSAAYEPCLRHLQEAMAFGAFGEWNRAGNTFIFEFFADRETF